MGSSQSTPVLGMASRGISGEWEWSGLQDYNFAFDREEQRSAWEAFSSASDGEQQRSGLEDYDLAFDIQLAEVLQASQEGDDFVEAWRIHQDEAYALLVARLQGDLLESCRICMDEDKLPEEMMSVQACEHRFCVQCMKQHAEVKVKDGIVEIRCPSEGCVSFLDHDTCIRLLSQESVELLEKIKLELSIPLEFRVYCPYTECSQPMDKRLLEETVLPLNSPSSSSSSSSSPSSASSSSVSSAASTSSPPTFMVQCLVCSNRFCLKCMVPWHFGMRCSEFDKVPLGLRDFDGVKLYKLASKNNWKQCPQCSSMIELTHGCYHIVCRCGYEFCYLCRKKWSSRHVSSTKCPFWDEKKLVKKNK